MKTNTRYLFLASCVCALALAPHSVAADQSTSTSSKSSTYSGAEKTFTGSVTAVDLSQHTLKVQGEFLFGKSFNLGAACSYALLDGVDNAPAGLHAGQKVRVIYQSVDGVLVADRVLQQPMRFTGWVKAVNPNAHTVTVQSGGFGVSRQFQFVDGGRVTLLGDKTGTFADIQPGNHVSLTYEEPPGMATAQNIAQTSATFTGALTAIDLDAKTVKAKTMFDSRSFNLGEHCVIDLDGKGGGRLSDLKPDEKLVFTYDDISGVNVVNRIAPAKETAESVSASNMPGGS
jgi:predicted RNA-binding protein